MYGTYSTLNRRSQRKQPAQAFALVLALLALTYGGIAKGQGEGAERKRVLTIRGQVLNQATKEPIGRAVVTVAGGDYATMTDDRGQFELKIREQQEPQPAQGSVVGSRIVTRFRNPSMLEARKPGFLPHNRATIARATKEDQEEATIYLVPEALIVGRVSVPGAEAQGIQCQLYRLMTTAGKQSWTPAETFPAWAKGEFRFSGLEAGTYRLVTHEMMDRDSLPLASGAATSGYPPVYYPNTTDFSAAASIVVKAGETKQFNLTVARREYFPVRIPVANPPATPALNVEVYPRGHWGPGWSLGYDPREQVINGALPNGNYTVEADAFGDVQSTGIVNLTVGGRAAEGPPMNLVPNATVSVNVREEFQGQNAGPGETLTYTTNGQQQESLKAQVMLTPLDDSQAGQGTIGSQPAAGMQGRALTIRNVKPGRYRVNVMAFAGYAAVVESDGVDLLKQPLVVGMGGAVPPIEITLRDDGAEVSGVVEGSPAAQGNWQGSPGKPERYWSVLLLPLGRFVWQPLWLRTDGRFIMGSLPPGDYLLAAYDGTPGGVPVAEEEVMKTLEEKAQKFHVEAGEKITNLKVKVIAENEQE
jgi:hypothetical protein